MENNDKIDFLNNNCRIYNMTISQLSFYFLVLNVQEESTKKMIQFFMDKNKDSSELNLQAVEGDENSFIIIESELAQDVSKRNQALITSLVKGNFKNKYACLINIDGKNMITFNVEQIVQEDSEQIVIMGAILNHKEAELLKDMLKNEEKIVLEDFEVVEEIDQISGLFFEEEEVVKAEVDLEGEENLDKEFDQAEAEEEADYSEERVKLKKKHKKRKPSEDIEEENIKEIKMRRKRRRIDIDESNLAGDVDNFLAKLREAIELDKQSLANKRPALEKLKLLPQISKFLSNTYYQKLFLQYQGLELLQEWIKRNRDGTFPALNQISQMLDLLNNLSLSLSHLKSCQIGGYVMELSKSTKVSKQIQNKAKDLVEKWSRIVWDINTNYSDIDSENRMYEMIYQRNKRNRSEDGSDDEYRKENIEGVENKKEESVTNKRESDLYSHARIPKKGLFDFTIKPESNISDTKPEELARLRYNYFDSKKKGGRKKNE